MAKAKTKKKPASKKSPARKSAGNRISPDEGERLFARWCDLRDTTGFSGLARESSRTRPALRDYAARHNWEARVANIRKLEHDATDVDIAKRRAAKTRMARGITDQAVSSIFKPDPDDKNPDPKKRRMVLKVTPTLSDVARWSKYEDELLDKLPDRGEQTASNMTAEQITEALGVFSTLGPDGMSALGKLVVEQAKRLDAKNNPETIQALDKTRTC